MNKWLVAVWLMSTAVQAVPVYRWVDKTGQVNYSDRPGPGAVRIELTVGAAPGTVGSTPPPPGPALQPQTAAAAEDYETFAVVQPVADETLWATGGKVQIAIALSPELKPRHRLGLYLDGALRDVALRDTRFEIEEVHRGEHTLQAVILDEAGAELQRSAPVAFFVQQTSIHYPHNPGRAR